MSRTLLVVILTWLLVPAQAPGQIPPGYHIVDVPDLPGHEYFPRINNRGQVVFSWWREVGEQRTLEICQYDARTGELTQLTDDFVLDYLPDINDAGTVVWGRGLGPFDPNWGIYAPEIMMRTSDGTVTRITFDDAVDIGPSINNLDEVVWKRSGPWVCGGSVMDIYMFDGMRVFPITTNGLPDQVENQGPEINDHSEIVWTEYDFCNAPPGYNFRSRIMHHLNGVTSELTDGSFQPQGPANNNDGRVVWGSYDIALSRNIVEIWENGQVSLVTDDGTKPSINERGDIAFHRWEPARSAWNVFLLRDNEFLRLSDDDHWNLVPHLNDRGEAAWSSGNFPDTHIRLLLRYPDADLNCDADVNAFDVEPFIDALIDPERYAIRHPDCDRMLADVNGDGAVDAMDIEPFIQRLLQP